jgi:hypothetical protein
MYEERTYKFWNTGGVLGGVLRRLVRSIIGPDPTFGQYILVLCNDQNQGVIWPIDVFLLVPSFHSMH